MAGRWQPLQNAPPFNASTMLLLTDGTVMCQESGGMNWWRLTPDRGGGYEQGTWSPLAPMHHTRLYYASAVLADGRVFVAGGEYSDVGDETNTAEIYDPVRDSWTEIPGPSDWSSVGDAACCVLADGRLLMGNIDDERTALFDPATDSWVDGPLKDNRSSEETWTLLPDGTVLTPECTNHPKAEKYVPALNSWVSAGQTPVDLVEASSIEIGPALLLLDGRTFHVGATGKTSLYTKPSAPADPGTWEVGPSFPSDANQTLGAKDAPGCLLPSGKVLCVAGPVDGIAGDYLAPTFFFEFDGKELHRVPDASNAGGVPFVGRMLLLPTGQVLFAAGTPTIELYTPDHPHDPSWRPVIDSAPKRVRPGVSYNIYGRRFNGMSQAVSYGDDAAMATNYPLVRLSNETTGRVTYCRTVDHSSMGVATGDATVSTRFTLPFDTDLGPSELQVIANGIPSKAVRVEVLRAAPQVPIDDAFFAWLIGSLADGPLWVLGPNAPVPVGPWGPDLAAQAYDASARIVGGIVTLQGLGHEIARRRLSASAAVPPAVDPELQKVKPK
jgi:hypothetical protein